MQKRIVGLRTPPMPQGLLVLPRMSPACSVVVVLLLLLLLLVPLVPLVSLVVVMVVM